MIHKRWEGRSYKTGLNINYLSNGEFDGFGILIPVWDRQYVILKCRLFRGKRGYSSGQIMVMTVTVYNYDQVTK